MPFFTIEQIIEMSKTIFLILSTLLVGCATTPRYVVLNKQQSIFYTPEQINELNDLTCYLIGHCQEKREFDSIYVYHVRQCFLPFVYDYSSRQLLHPFAKEDLVDSVFLKKLMTGHFPYRRALGHGKKEFPYTFSLVFRKDKTYGGFAWMSWFTERRFAMKVRIPPADFINELENDSVFGILSLCNMEEWEGEQNILFAITRDKRIKVFSYNDSTTLKRWTLKEFGEKCLKLRE